MCIAGIYGTFSFPIQNKNCGAIYKKKGLPKNYNPAIRSIAPIRIPNMDVDADSIPRTIYPTMIPIFNGM
jgi:hypothetical protein